jgi:hypothetical protein
VASYLLITPERQSAVDFAAAVGAVHEPSLDVALPDGTPRHVYVLDHGDGGLVGSIRRSVYGELGLTEEIAGDPDGSGAVTVEEVRTALRALDSDRQLATCSLAELILPPGGTVLARADALRRVVRVGVEQAWPAGSDERIALTQTYPLLASGPIRELHLSRATRYRLLRRALDGVVDRLNGADGLGPVSQSSQLSAGW